MRKEKKYNASKKLSKTWEERVRRVGLDESHTRYQEEMVNIYLFVFKIYLCIQKYSYQKNKTFYL